MSVFRKNNSRQSLRSGKSQRRPITLQKSKVQEEQDHFQKEVDRAFPASVNYLDADKINKLNEKIRTMIRRFNEQLNDIINKNAVAIRMKENSNQLEKGIEDRIQVLQEEKKNNDKMLERMEIEIDKLRYREGEIREDDYELEIHKRIDVLRDKMKETEKVIVRLKLEVDNEGKRLYNVGQRKDNEVNASIKAELVHFKKEEYKTVDHISKLEEKIQQTEKKNDEADDRIAELTREAQEKGVDLSPNGPKKTRYEELMKQRDAEKKSVAVVEGQMKVRRDRIGHEMQLMRRQIHNIELQIKNLYEDIDVSLQKSRSLIQKNKQIQQVPSNVKMSLENIERSLVVPVLTDFYEFKPNRSRAISASRVRIPSAKKQTQQSVRNSKDKDDLLPLNPKMVAKSEDREKEPSHDKPQLGKKQHNEQDAYERIWKDQKMHASTPTASQAVAIEKQKPPAPPPPQAPEDDSKPKFMLKRRGANNPAENKPTDESKQKPQEVQLERNEQKETLNFQPQAEKPAVELDRPFAIGRLRNKKVEPAGYLPSEPPAQVVAPSKQPQETHKSVAPSIQIKPKLTLEENNKPEEKEPASTFQTEVQQDKPIVPRRMLMRKRGDQQEQGGGGYNPTFNEPKSQLTSANEGKPSLNPPHIQPATHSQDASLKQPPRDTEEKPRNPYAPSTVQAPTPANNPYAPTNNPYAPKPDAQPYQPQREGRLKKGKVQIPKQKFSIYDAAEENADINEFMSGPKAQDTPSAVPKKEADDEPDLQKLLGISQARPADPEDELLFGRKEEPKRMMRIRRPAADGDPY